MLPILYTIPKWELIRGTGHSTRYYVPELGRWISSKYLSRDLKEIGMTVQEYYDRWFLNITAPSERPKCKKCGKELKFGRMSSGYPEYCSISCFKSLTMMGNSNTLGHKLTDEHKEKISKGVLKAFDENGTREKLRASSKKRYEDPKEREKQSISQKKRYEDPKEREKAGKYLNTKSSIQKRSISHKLRYVKNPDLRKESSERVIKFYVDHPEKREQQSESHRKLWEDPSPQLLATLGNVSRGITNYIYSPYENKDIKLDSMLERKFFEEYMRNPKVKSIVRLPIRFRYLDSLKDVYRTYYPDFSVEYIDGSLEIIEVKPDFQVNDTNVSDKRESAIDMCYLLGIVYSIYTEKNYYKYI